MKRLIPKIKKISKSEEGLALDTAIRQGAKALLLYTPGLEDNQQCAGYHAFRMLCISNDPLPNESTILNPRVSGSFLLSRFHENLRKDVLLVARQIRKLYNIKEKDEKKEGTSGN